MKVKLCAAVAAIMCCLAFSQEARANRIIANTDMYYDSTQNRMVAYTEASSSYSAGLYYCISVEVYLTGGGQWAANSAWDGCTQGYAYTQTSLPYDPNVEYETNGNHHADPYYRDGTGETIDYYNFQDFMQGTPVNYPGLYQFLGPGPRRPSLGQIILGTTYAIFSQGSVHGPPHHLRVVFDNTGRLQCQSAQRITTYDAVDDRGRRVGRTPIQETFLNLTQNTCNSTQPSPSSCQNCPGGRFTDTVRVGCPSVGGDCGFDISPNRIQWSPRGRLPVTLATFNVRARHSEVLLGGVGGSGYYDQFRSGTEIFRDGTIR